MNITVREAAPADIEVLGAMYRRLESEMTALHPQWPRRDGLAEPIRQTMEEIMEEPESILLVGEIDGVVLGMLVAVVERSLPQAGFEPVGSIRIVFTAPEAREVGVAEAMRAEALGRLRARGVTKFDAHVLPGHRLAKNFFEAGGFSARSIVMHHDDHPTERPGRDPRAL